MIRRRANYPIALALAVLSAGAGAADPGTKLIHVVDEGTHKSLRGLAVEITSQAVVNCIKAPCPQQSAQRWTGTTDEHGVLAYPAALDKPGAIVYMHAVGSTFSSDVHGEGKKDKKGLPIVKLQPAVEVKKP